MQVLQDPSLLRIIFSACCKDSPTTPARLRSVCKLWRDVIATQADLWFLNAGGTLFQGQAKGEAIANHLLSVLKPSTRQAASSAITFLENVFRMDEAAIDRLIDINAHNPQPDEGDYDPDGGQNETPHFFVSCVPSFTI